MGKPSARHKRKWAQTAPIKTLLNPSFVYRQDGYELYVIRFTLHYNSEKGDCQGKDKSELKLEFIIHNYKLQIVVLPSAMIEYMGDSPYNHL